MVKLEFGAEVWLGCQGRGRPGPNVQIGEVSPPYPHAFNYSAVDEFVASGGGLPAVRRG
jgi:hypothetical protein